MYIFTVHLQSNNANTEIWLMKKPIKSKSNTCTRIYPYWLNRILQIFFVVASDPLPHPWAFLIHRLNIAFLHYSETTYSLKCQVQDWHDALRWGSPWLIGWSSGCYQYIKVSTQKKTDQWQLYRQIGESMIRTKSEKRHKIGMGSKSSSKRICFSSAMCLSGEDGSRTKYFTPTYTRPL